MKKVLSVILGAAMLLSMFTVSGFAGGEEVVRGTPPPYNAATGQYEVSTVDHLLYLSGDWKEGAPRDGNYVLLNDIDMAGVEGFQPIASNKKRGYLGTFDGQYHAIRNLKIEYLEKYVGLFGYVGNENEQAYIKNLAVLDCDIIGKQNVGGIAGVCYGTVLNCIVTGTVEVDQNASNAHTAGGIAGKVKEGEGPIIGHVENCYTDCTMIAPYDVGGIAGIQDGGGYIGKCYAAGTVEASQGGHSGGGIVGSFNAGEYLTQCVAVQDTVTGVRNVDKIVGQLADESGTNIKNNLAWEGTLLAGNEPADHPNNPTYTEVSGKALAQKTTYIDLGWDFLKDWQWIGEEKNGYPVPKGFAWDIVAAPEYAFQGIRIIHNQVNRAEQNAGAVISARIVSDGGVKDAQVYYGRTLDGTAFTEKVAMTKDGDVYKAMLPTDTAGMLYYFIRAESDAESATKPCYITECYGLYIDDGSIQGEPEQISVTVGEKQGTLRFNWLTAPEVTDTVLQYKVKGDADWITASGEGGVIYVTEGWKEKYSHRAVSGELPADAQIIYRVGDGKAFMSAEYEIKAPAPKQSDSFSFLFVSDPQSVTEEDYESFKNSMDYALTVSKPEFTLITGDITQDGYKSGEWNACFNVMQDFFAANPVIALAGNHEMKGDWNFISYAGRFNMPGGASGTSFDNTIGCFEYGDACIVVINTEVTPPAEKPDIIAKQLAWAKKCFEQSGKKWRILAAHAGPYTSNHPGDEVKPYLIDAVDEMKVDLFLNGHDHIYIRGSVKADQRVPVGEGTMYITAGTVGNKYYKYLPASDPYTDFYADDEDQQIFSVITVSKDAITGLAYQRAPMDEETEEIDWNNWTVIDRYTISNSLAEGKSAADSAPAAPEAAAPAQAQENEALYYIVVAGDWLSKIAPRYETTWQELARLNHLKNPDLIYPGQRIRVK